MTTPIRYVLAACLATAVATVSFADHHGGSHHATLFQTTFLHGYEDASGKVLQLAEAFSDEGYEWRPAEGIRSVRESILHVAAANYFLASKLGAKLPDGVNPRGMEKSIHGKAATIAVLKQSIEAAKAAVAATGEADLATTIDFFGTPSPKMAAVLANEHLGQLIAYARSTGVVPPWSE